MLPKAVRMRIRFNRLRRKAHCAGLGGYLALAKWMQGACWMPWEPAGEWASSQTFSSFMQGDYGRGKIFVRKVRHGKPAAA